MSLPPNMERLELARQDANEALIPAPRDLLYPKYTPAPRTKTVRDLLLASPFFGPYMRYYEEEKEKERQEKEKERDTALPAERERPDPFGLFKR